MKKASMLWQVVIAIILAIIIGEVTGTTASVFGITFFAVFSLGGKLFLNLLTLLVVPLVSSSIIQGISQMGKDKSFARLGGKTFFFYISTTLLAVLTGLVFVNLLQPGVHSQELVANTGVASVLTPLPAHEEGFSQILFKFIPINIFEAAAQGNMLGVIFFSFLFGFALAKMESKAADTLSNFWQGLFHTMMKMTHFAMKALPLGVFCLVAKVIAAKGIESIESLALFFLTVVLGLLVFVFVILPLYLKLMGLSPLRHFRAMAPALITAFSTSSSAATLPITIDCVEKRAGVSNRICSFVVPLGTSINLAGSALYECVAALFIAQVYGIEISVIHQFLIVILSLVTSMGVAGVPSGSLVAILIVLNAMGFPAEGLALIIPVDRVLDMCRTTANVFSDASCAVLVAHSEGEPVLKSR